MGAIGFVRLLIIAVILISMARIALAAGPQCIIARQEVFAAGGEKVRLVRASGLGPAANLGIFKAPLAVNTDGAPTSYHPEDFLGQTLAINRIDNGLSIKSTTGNRITVTKKIEVFDRWRRSGSWTPPPGYRIVWQNVIVADAAGKPCIFKTANAGYFGSLTALKNNLPANACGECEVNDQLDQRVIPAIVLRGNTNPLKDFGARVGDLVLAVNPANGVMVAAIIGDTGDGDRIGEGSVALNMALLQSTAQPKIYSEALKLDTRNQDIIVAVIPGSRTYKRERPYTANNIAARVETWANEHGYGSLPQLAEVMKGCADGI